MSATADIVLVPCRSVLFVLPMLLLPFRAIKGLAIAVVVVIWCMVIHSVDWDASLTPRIVLKIAGLWVGLVFVFHAMRQEWRIWNGLDQWPNPSGRYYDRWLLLSDEGTGDYYPWLAAQKNWQEPWASWVLMDKGTSQSADVIR